MVRAAALIAALCVAPVSAQTSEAADQEFVFYGERIWQRVVTTDAGTIAYLDFADVLQPRRSQVTVWVLFDHSRNRTEASRRELILTSFSCDSRYISQIQNARFAADGSQMPTRDRWHGSAVPGTVNELLLNRICAPDQ